MLRAEWELLSLDSNLFNPSTLLSFKDASLCPNYPVFIVSSSIQLLTGTPEEHKSNKLFVVNSF